MGKDVETMTLEEMKRRKQELGYSVEALVKLTGIPRGTLQKIFSGQTKSPRRETIEKLTAVLGSYTAAGQHKAGIVAETSPVYGSTARQVDNPYGDKMQGEYTIEDYLALPDDKRYELIDGVIYEMASPAVIHQMIAGFLYYQFMSCVEKHQVETCYPYISPLDVQLDKDNKTMVQPDVMICCDRELDSGKRIFGAPEFLAEVLSPSSRQRDMFIKLNKYKNAGVREYWLINPAKQQVIVYLFYKDDDVSCYTFDDTIPVSISDGLCDVSFAPLKKRLAAMEV